MHIIKKLIVLFLVVVTFNCSKDDDKQPTVNNGFVVNGTVYKTDKAKASTMSPYRLVFYSGSREDRDHLADFSLIIENALEYPKLEVGEYTTNHTHGKLIDFYHQILFQKKTKNLAYTEYWRQDSNFVSGKVNIHNIKFSGEDFLSRRITFINIDYEFKWNDKTIVGNYVGDVQTWN